MSPAILIVVIATLGQAPSASTPVAPLLGPSLLEPLPAEQLPSVAPSFEDDVSAGLVATDMPEIDWLANWQKGYLDLLHDDGRALAGFYDPFSFQFAYGSAGVQAYRLGWYSYNDYVLMSRSPTTVGGNFQDQQWNAWMRYAWLLRNSTVFTLTGWMNGKFWMGPTGINLPPGAAEFIGDFQWASAFASAWNWQLGFAPQLNGTFNDRINSNALMADVRAVLLLRASPQWLFAFGAAYWNRASDHLIPYGGVVWAPGDRWEIRAMFPKSRASYYVGRLRGADTWLYAAGEYNLEAYQVDLEGPRLSVRGETSDYRVLLGASATAGIWTLFVEGGLVTDRHFRFRGDAPDFQLDDCGVLRTGLLF